MLIENKKKSRREQRLQNIAVIYKHELLNYDYNISEIAHEYDLNKEQIDHILSVIKWDNFNKKVLNKFLNTDWTLERISPLLRAIILNACTEFHTLNPRIVINEAIEITKYYFGKPNELENAKQNEEKYYKFVNGVLENFYKAIISIEAKTIDAK
ncbi:antitermination protein NusB [Mycoplasmopsis felis]|uniref:transcription antitermination factor NusB n=1 Tax=Mycoplasmopsis felis TaxID=33923 RepID=UPI003A4DEA2B